MRGLGERLNGIQEVSGSIPLISTKKTVDAIASAVFLLSIALECHSSAIFLLLFRQKCVIILC